MNKHDEKSGLSLLAVYGGLVIASVGGAVGMMFAADAAVPSYAGVIFIMAMSTALVAPWPAAIWITGPPRRG